MAWVCPICSTNNEEHEHNCIVCDYVRDSDKICTLTYNKVQNLRLSGHVVIPEEFNVIGEGAFKGRTDIESVTIHSRVRKISKEAFCGCVNLKNIVCDSELETVGIRAFAECSALPVSSRVRSKYVAKDAYRITPQPVTKPSTETAPIAPKSYKPQMNIGKIVAEIILLGMLVPAFAVGMNFFVSAFQSGISVGYSTLIGVTLLSLLVLSICDKFGDEDEKSLLQEKLLLPTVIAVLLLYVVSVIFGATLRWGLVSVGAIFLLGEFVLFGTTVYSKQYQGILILVLLIITNGILLWRMIGV